MINETGEVSIGGTSSLKAIREGAMGLAGFICGLLITATLAAAFIIGAEWMGRVLLPWLFLASLLAVGAGVIVGLPLAAIPQTRGYTGIGFFILSYLFGLTLWFLGFFLTLELWGIWAVVFGLFVLGVGVVPFGLFAALFAGMWLEVGIILLLLVLTVGTRTAGIMMVDHAS